MVNSDKMIDTLMATVIFTALIGTIGASIAAVTNVTGAALVLLGLTTLFVVIGFIRGIIKSMK